MTTGSEQGQSEHSLSPGIYYIIRLPDAWKLCVYRYADQPELDHVDFWRRKLAFQLAVHWRHLLNSTAMELERQLRDCYYAFPRGRVTCTQKKFNVLHGKDLRPFMHVTRRQIEAAFGIVGQARWMEDDHEHCLEEDKEHARKLLRLRDNWPHRDVFGDFVQ